MATKRYASILGSLAILASVLIPVALADHETKGRKMDCELTYNLKGWSAFYKTAKGEGTITCDNGQSADVVLRVRGGGVTFGKTEIVHGKGEISNVRSIDEIFGSYAAASAHAGAVKAADAQVMTKGEVSIALAGHGRGIDVGVDFSKFKISKASSTDHDR